MLHIPVKNIEFKIYCKYVYLHAYKLYHVVYCGNEIEKKRKKKRRIIILKYHFALLLHTTPKAFDASIEAAYSGDVVSLASTMASVNRRAAIVADVLLVKPFCSGFCRALNKFRERCFKHVVCLCV